MLLSVCVVCVCCVCVHAGELRGGRGGKGSSLSRATEYINIHNCAIESIDASHQKYHE